MTIDLTHDEVKQIATLLRDMAADGCKLDKLSDVAVVGVAARVRHADIVNLLTGTRLLPDMTNPPKGVWDGNCLPGRINHQYGVGGMSAQCIWCHRYYGDITAARQRCHYANPRRKRRSS